MEIVFEPVFKGKPSSCVSSIRGCFWDRGSETLREQHITDFDTGYHMGSRSSIQHVVEGLMSAHTQVKDSISGGEALTSLCRGL